MAVAPKKVDPQPRVDLPFGLFSVVSFRESSDKHWLNGIEWEAMTCDPATGIEVVDCDDLVNFEQTFSGAWPVGEAAAFVVQGSYKCGAPGGGALREAEEKAGAHLLAREQTQAEFYLWRRMAQDATDVHSAGALDPEFALAALEDWLGSTYGSLGAIHASRGAASLWPTNIDSRGSRLYTKIGTPVSAGGGYPRTAPDGSPAAAGETWVYASPALFGYRGEVYSQGVQLDRGHNDLTAVANRDYAIGYDPCGVAAVRMKTA